MEHQMRKFCNTIRIAVTLTMARTFGAYKHTICGEGWPDCAVYEWRGRLWAIPTSPLADN
jgi:hypothetical protein